MLLKDNEIKRSSGILMPIFSLPSPYGIGTLGEEAYKFVDFLKKAGQSYWQILPLNPTNYGDSPYQSFSSAAGNPYFIDLDILNSLGLLEKWEYENVDFGSDPNNIDYEKMYYNRMPVLRLAFSRFDKTNPDYIAFCKKEANWLDEYALFMAIKKEEGGVSWHNWSDPYRLRDPKALKKAKTDFADEIEFYKFLQYEFYREWNYLKTYANSQGIKIIGDMPIYVADDSADIWSNTEQFDLDDDLLPNVVAGCPPDAFCDDGQLWGMPVYDWKYMKNDTVPYKWWRARMKRALEVYDIVRIDHFRGFESFYCIPYGDETARNGKWRKGPGMNLFKAMREDFGNDMPIIAEDLGFLTPAVKKLLKTSGFPGMKVLQFAFDSREENDYLPHNYDKNCVVYTGTHDNDTILGWTVSAPPEDVKAARKYMNVNENDNFVWAMIRTALMSVADTAILMMADLVCLGSEGRINTPSTVGNNWKWRISKDNINDWLADIVYGNTALYYRLPKPETPEE